MNILKMTEKERETLKLAKKYEKTINKFRFIAIVDGRSLIYWRGNYLQETQYQESDYCSKCACIELVTKRSCPLFLMLHQKCPTMKMGAYFEKIGNDFTGV